MFPSWPKIIRHFATNLEKSFYVTTPIFYVNAAPHIGHLYSALIADAICRYKRLKLPNCDIRLSTGADEHGTKVAQAADYRNVMVSNYCESISQNYKTIFKKANVQFDDFIRTTEQRHKDAVAHFWMILKKRGYIYLDKYCGWYCIPDETFLTENQLRLDESNGLRYSVESGHIVEWTEEINFMFSLSKVQNDVINWLKEGNKVKPVKFEKILLDMLNEPLPDVSVSRPKSRVHWAIPVPNDSTQTVYVWLDALINYLSSVGYPNEKYLKYWPAGIHVVGKDILKFHGIYWPAFLIAAGLEPPKQLYVHSHWTVDGQKMSKSKNNVVSPDAAAVHYSMEGLRYFLLREGVAHSDGNYSGLKALRILNSELADTLGNLLSRTCAKSLNPHQIYPVPHLTHLHDIMQLAAAQHLKDSLGKLQDECNRHYEENNFYLVVDTVMSTLHAANNFFETARPWEYKKGGVKENIPYLECIISMTMDALRLCGIALQPIVPHLSERLLNKLSVPLEERLWYNLKESFANADIVERYQNTNAKARLLSNIDAMLFKRIMMPEEPSSSVTITNKPTLKGTQKMKISPKKKRKDSTEKHVAAA